MKHYAEVRPIHLVPVKRRRGWRAPRGQAMVEYSVVAHFLLLGGGLALLPVISLMLEALTLFYDSVYSVVQTAAV
jgi:hypothetical protein